jgi:hypothetical protein
MQGLSPALEKFRNRCTPGLCGQLLYQLIAGRCATLDGRDAPATSARALWLLNSVIASCMLHRSEQHGASIAGMRVAVITGAGPILWPPDLHGYQNGFG